MLATVPAALDRGPAWAVNTTIACNAAATLWCVERIDHAECVERNLRDKVIAPDFRYPMVDGRLALAQLCALQRRYDEAVEWFAKARTVLDEQGARPLRAIVDYDEALMYVRRGEPGDAKRAAPLLEAALAQFRDIGMPGWIRCAEHLLRTGTEWRPAVPDAPAPAADELAATPASAVARVENTVRCTVRRSGEFWTVVFEGTASQHKDTRGLQYLARLLAHPGREFHATELVGLLAAAPQPLRRMAADDPTAAELGDAGTRLDPTALRQYQRRLAEARESSEAEADNDLGRRRAPARRARAAGRRARPSRAARRAGSGARRAGAQRGRQAHPLSAAADQRRASRPRVSAHGRDPHRIRVRVHPATAAAHRVRVLTSAAGRCRPPMASPLDRPSRLRAGKRGTAGVPRPRGPPVSKRDVSQHVPMGRALSHHHQ